MTIVGLIDRRQRHIWKDKDEECLLPLLVMSNGQKYFYIIQLLNSRNRINQRPTHFSFLHDNIVLIEWEYITLSNSFSINYSNFFLLNHLDLNLVVRKVCIEQTRNSKIDVAVVFWFHCVWVGWWIDCFRE